MSNALLVGCLVDRITSRLPHLTGSPRTVEGDEVLTITRATLIDLSRTSIASILESIVSILEEIGEPYKCVAEHPSYVLQSELFLLSLAADCCAAASGAVKGSTKPLDDHVVSRLFDVFKGLLQPLPDEYVLPTASLIGILTEHSPTFCVQRSDTFEGADCLENCLTAFERDVRLLLEFITVSSWDSVFEYVKRTLYTIRTSSFPDGGQADIQNPVRDSEAPALVTLRMISFFVLDSSKLGRLIQEICSSYLHFRRSYQSTIAVALPLTILRWVERCPHEFVWLHLNHRRLEGGADTLFDMTQTGIDGSRRSAVLYPLQTALLLLLPDVFEVASNLREAKGSSLIKKTMFLDGLRKALKNGNERAACCVVQLLRAARHFEAEADSALVSYAMDVQDEVRDAVFSASRSGLPIFDQDVVTGTFVGIVHLGLDEAAESLIDVCTSSSAPSCFKLAVVQACSYFSSQRDAFRYAELFKNTIPFIRTEFAAASKQPYSAHAFERSMRLETLRFLDASPGSMGNKEGIVSFLGPFLSCLLSEDQVLRRLSLSVAKRLFSRHRDLFRTLKAEDDTVLQSLRRDVWTQSSSVLSNLCASVRKNNDGHTIEQLHEFLTARHAFLEALPDLRLIPRESRLIVETAATLETTILVLLCSADVVMCQKVTACTQLFIDEWSFIGRSAEPATLALSAYRNEAVYREIASPSFRFTGLVAFQKRTRSILRRFRFPTSGILDAWQVVFDKWTHLSKDVSTVTSDGIDDNLLAEWRNCSGFLASLGGVCTSEYAAKLDEPFDSMAWVDAVRPDHDEESALSRFLRLAVQLLGCSNIKVREAMRDVLSTDISPVLSPALFGALQSELDVLLGGALASEESGQEGEIIFAEQAASLLKTMVEGLESTPGAGSSTSVHLGALTLNFARFLDSTAGTPANLRVKIKICQLCCAVTKRKELLNLRDDVRIRNQLLEHIFGWIARPFAPKQDQFVTVARQDDRRRLQRDLDKECLKTLADLTFRLPLQPSETQTDAGLSDVKSQMFHTYFNRFLSLLSFAGQDKTRGDSSFGREDASSNSNLVITVLSNLLSANIDVGLKHSLNIGYHENVEIRAAFVRVLCNILTQGTEFSSLTDSAVSDKYEELLSLLTTDLSLPLAMSSICPSSEVDELSICFLTIFEQRGLIFELFDALIRQEIAQTENSTEILRRSCVATKMLSVYAKWKGAPYLRSTLQRVLERLLLTSHDLDLELDPARMSSDEELEKNATQLEIVAKAFMDNICASTSDVPASFRRICSIISNAVVPRFPEAKYTAVGAFVFLRFFCPAIVAPEAEGLVENAPTKEMRRGLLLIAKVIQNLANNVLFGTKEPYMVPLNEFLVQNINSVAGYLHEISIPLDPIELFPNTSLSDFGSCVALHRFIYDHWDHIRQTLTSKGRKDVMKGAADSPRSSPPALEPLRGLVANIGPPPLAISWNRPHLSRNAPPLYSKFQNFMLKNAFKNAESFSTSHAVYDCGESKDGLSTICIILRHIENESIDHETLLYCFLKIASRLWHEPFGLFIDATCYNGRLEPSDGLLSMFEDLAPAELTQNFARVYIYNMNSAFKRCFRRLLRSSARQENSVFHPRKMDYYLMSTLNDLKIHFPLNHIHLPKETISVVTDTMQVFESVTRLSKSKGKIEVVVKIGSQFVQVTTANKQDVLSGLQFSCIINDIFRLGDIEEAAAQPADDPAAFNLRADGGKIVMCFNSAEKVELLQTLRNAKAKHTKDSRMPKLVERLVRPQDVPGTILNLALTNLSSPYHILRLASYNLLGALCKSFNFDAAARFTCNNSLAVPMEPARFIVDISTELAHSEPQLTSDFLTEFFVSWESVPEERRPLSLEYLSPWLYNLRTIVLLAEADGDKGKDKVAALLRKLIDVAILDENLTYFLGQHAWPAIAQDEVLLEIILDELVKIAITYGSRTETLDVLSSVITGFGTITMRGKIASRLRKALNRSSLRPTRHLPDNSVWGEICVLLQLSLALSFDSRVQSQMFLPETFHIVTMMANTGPTEIRTLVHKLLVNTVHAICSSFHLEDTRLLRVRALLDSISDGRGDVYAPTPPMVKDTASGSTTLESDLTLSATESLTTMLFEMCFVASPSIDVANAWRCRWMSLVASTAFQNNPAVQPRAFAVMGCLAREEVDDDLLYQVLVALRNSISQFGQDGQSEMLISIITSLSKMMTKLPSASRYGPQLFWLAMSLVRLVPSGLFNCTAQFLQSVLTNIGTIGNISGERLIPLLLQCRAQLEEAVLPLDDAYGIHFNEDTFHFAVCACLVRGLTDTVTRPSAAHVLASFLEMASRPEQPSKSVATDFPSHALPYLALLLARGLSYEEFSEATWLRNACTDKMLITSPALQNVDALSDKELFLISAIQLVDFHYLEDSAQTRILHWINDLATKRPAALVNLCGAIPSILNDVLRHGQESTALEAAHNLLSTISSHDEFVDAIESTVPLSRLLDAMGFSGLWVTGDQSGAVDIKAECFELTEKLIELIVI